MPLHARTHMVFLIGSLLPSLSLPRFHNLSLSNLPTLLYFPIQYSPSNTFPSSSAPILAPSIFPLLQALLSATLAPVLSFWSVDIQSG